MQKIHRSLRNPVKLQGQESRLPFLELNGLFQYCGAQHRKQTNFFTNKIQTFLSSTLPQPSFIFYTHLLGVNFCSIILRKSHCKSCVNLLYVMRTLSIFSLLIQFDFQSRKLMVLTAIFGDFKL